MMPDISSPGCLRDLIGAGDDPCLFAPDTSNGPWYTSTSLCLICYQMTVSVEPQYTILTGELKAIFPSETICKVLDRLVVLWLPVSFGFPVSRLERSGEREGGADGPEGAK